MIRLADISRADLVTVISKMCVNVWLIRLVVLVLFLLPVLGWGLYAIIWLITPWRDNSIPLERMLNRNRRVKN